MDKKVSGFGHMVFKNIVETTRKLRPNYLKTPTKASLMSPAPQKAGLAQNKVSDEKELTPGRINEEKIPPLKGPFKKL